MKNQTIQHTDLSLLERMADSRYRSDAWALFVKQYTLLFFTWFKRWNVDPFTMEDVLQDTLVRVFSDFKQFQRHQHGSFRAWLKALAFASWKQLVEDSQRQLAQRSVNPARAQNWGVLSSELAANHLVELFDAWATEEILNLAMVRARRRATSEVWNTYERISLKNQSVHEVSQAMHIKPVQVYDRVSQMRKLIRQELEDLEEQGS